MSQTSDSRAATTGVTGATGESVATLSASERLFAGGGEMAALMRATNWAATPLGPVADWSPSLRMMVPMLLANRFPMLLWWGPDFLQLYNDAYRPVLGDKHPRYLGRSVRECWSEIIDVIGPLIETPFSGGPATWMDDILLEVNRRGFVEETHFTIAYSPVPDVTAPGGIGGVLATVNEISEKVVAERRMSALRDLGARSAEAKSAEEACQIASETLARYPKDIPFALLYLLSPDGKQASLAAAVGVAMDAPISPLQIEMKPGARASAAQTWPLTAAARAGTIQLVEDLAGRFGAEAIPAGPWSDAPHGAAVAPIRSNLKGQVAGFLVAGVSARLRFDDAYAGFLDLVCGQLTTAITSARAYEEERRRAEALAEIDRAKTAFFSNVSHEFRTPLTLLLGPLEDALATTGEELTLRQRERLEIIRRNGVRLLRLVNTLLDFARMEAGRAQAVYEPTNLATYTAELASSFRSLIERAGMELVVDCPPLAEQLAEPVFVDREMWEKIVLNLLSNAFKFTFAGKITVSLRPAGTARGAKDGKEAQDGKSGAVRRVELMVRDTGTGIPAAELGRLFERFHRVQGARSRSFEGSGIGLALVADLVHLHGGTIEVVSVEGTGTTFFVRLPVGADHLPADRIRASREQVSTALGATAYVEEAGRWLNEEVLDDDALGGALAGLREADAPSAPGERQAARILIADDNADMRDYLRRLLAERYTEIEMVADGAAALAAVRARPPDLVVSDVMMPRLDGFGLLRALKDDPATSAIPVILLSARAGEEATVEGLEAGADDYLVKPFSAREALARIAARLEIARLRRESAERASLLEAVFAALPGRVTLFDEHGTMLRLNSAAEQIAGPGRDGARMEDVARLYDLRRPDGAPLATAELPLRRALRGETVMDAELVLRDAQGHDQTILAGAAPYYDNTGRLRGAVSITHDITARREAERLAEERARELEVTFAAITDAVFLYDAEGHIVQANPAARTIFGLGDYPEYERLAPQERATGIKVRDEQGRPIAAEESGLMRLLRGEELTGPNMLDVRLTLPNGRDLDVNIAGAPLRDARGEVTGAIAIARDVTERKRLEQGAHESLAALLAMAQALVAPPGETAAADAEAGAGLPPEMAALATTPRALAARRVLALVQRVFTSQFTAVGLGDLEADTLDPVAVVGVTPEIERRWLDGLLGQPMSAYFSPPLIARVRAEEAFEINASAEPPVPGQDYLGTQQVLLVSQRMLDGRYCIIAVEARDRPPFERYEYDLARAAVRLVALVIERERLTRERDEGRLRELALEEATRRMDGFLGIASHELRTPLTSVTANIQMAGKQLRNARQSADGDSARAGRDGAGGPVATDRLGRAGMLLERAERQVTRLDRLVGDLLDASRIQADKLELRLEACDLNAIVREAVSEQRASWPDRPITLDRGSQEPLSLWADADRIGQVVTNLLTNALKYSADPAPIAVEARRIGDRARVAVRDQGPGLTPEQQARLFERFYRAPGIEEQNGPGVGLGLGLYICKTIIERHGGRIGVESAPGKGSTFWFTLPLSERARAELEFTSGK